MSVHDVGDGLRMWVLFRDMRGEQVEPSSIEWTMRKPDGTVETLDFDTPVEEDLDIASEALGQTLTEVTGIRYADVTFDASGRWYVRVEAEGVVPQVEEWHETVLARKVAEPVP